MLKLFKRRGKSKGKEDNIAAPAIVAMNVPEVGQVLAQHFWKLQKRCTPLVEFLRREEFFRAKFLREGIIEQLEEHTPNTLDNLENTLNRALEAIKAERKKLAISVQPLP